MINEEQYEFNDKIECFEAIKENLNEIKELYLNFYHNILEKYNEIIKNIENIIHIINNKSYNDIKNECENLSNKLFNFSENIKKSSFENDFKIKNIIEKLEYFHQKIEADILNNSEIINSYSRKNMFELDEEIYLKKYSNFSFIKELSLLYHEYNKEKDIYSEDFDRITDIKGKEIIKSNNHFLIKQKITYKNNNRLDEIEEKEYLTNSLDLSFGLQNFEKYDDSLFISENVILLFNKDIKNKFAFSNRLNTNIFFSEKSGIGKSFLLKSLLLNSENKNNKKSKNSDKSFSNNLNHHFFVHF